MKKYIQHIISIPLLLLIGCCITGCRLIPGVKSYEVYNLTNDTIVAYFATGFYVFGPTAYPDTLLPEDRTWVLERTNRQIQLSECISETVVPPHTRDGSAPVLYKNGRLGEVLPRDTLSVFIISKDTLRKYGYDDVRRNNRILVRYDLSSKVA